MKLHFEVQLKKGQRSDHGHSVTNPAHFPSFVLVFNDDWNDYSYRTWFCLYYYGEDRVQRKIGELKLMCRGKVNSYDALDKTFDGSLSDDYCSLGIEPSYYFKIYKLFKGKQKLIEELLVSLRDCAFNQNIYEEFIEDDIFNTSLLREDSSMQAFNEAPYMLNGGNKEAAYSFKVHFAPDYLNGAFADWNVRLFYDSPPFMRMVGLIGDNGVGKTQMLRWLVKSLVSNESSSQSLPLYRSCLAISSTPFDNYANINTNQYRIPYHYFSVEQNIDNTEIEILSCINEIFRRPLIYQRPMASLYKEALNDILGESIGNVIEYVDDEDTYRINKCLLHEQILIMSSGQLHIFKLLSFIHAHIKLSSLIVIDEPEVHMHPQFVVLFMAMLGKILHRFRSFAVIVTHSPLVVREMVGQNVYLMTLVEDNIPNVGKVGFETFGADASELYMNIFHYNEHMSSFYYYIKSIGKGSRNTYDKAIKYIMKFAPKLSLNARLSIRDYLE